MNTWVRHIGTITGHDGGTIRLDTRYGHAVITFTPGVCLNPDQADAFDTLLNRTLTEAGADYDLLNADDPAPDRLEQEEPS